MVEVSATFRFSERTYFLAVVLLDKYLTASGQQGCCFQNKDIHPLGVTAMYLASKFEDIVPLHSKVVADRIAHKAVSDIEIRKLEADFLSRLGFFLDFVTPFDFLETYMETIASRYFRCHSIQLDARVVLGDSEGEREGVVVERLKKVGQMSKLLVRMAMQCVDFCLYSYSTLVMAAIYASTAFLKHSKAYQSEDCALFCTHLRQIIFQLL